MSRWLSLGVVLLVGCVAGPRPVTQERLKALGTRSYRGAFDEVFDATSLSLEALGYRVVQSDRQLGTLTATLADGTGFDVDVSSHDDDQTVLPLPTGRAEWVMDGAEGVEARWAALEKATKALLATWRAHPELRFDPRTNELSVLKVRVATPKRWEVLDLAMDRRRAVLQRFKPGKAQLNPTFLVDVARRSPGRSRERAVVEAASVAFSGPRTLALAATVTPSASRRGHSGTTQLRYDGDAWNVTWYTLDAHDGAWAVHVVGLCGLPDETDGCDEEWAALVDSFTAPGFEFER